MPVAPNNTNYAPIPFHIQIGVTGHRDLTLTEQLEKSINKALTIELKNILRWDEKYQTPLTYSILSPLAEGADRFVAAQAMQLLDAKLEALLPMNEDEYMEDFTSQESCLEFKNFLKQAKNCHQLIKKPLAEVYPGKTTTEQRVHAYEKTGRYVVDNCDILIAIWDGKPAKSNAGTGAVVEHAKKKGKPMIIVSANDPSKIEVVTGNDNITELFKKYDQFNSFAIDPDFQAFEILKISGGIFSGDYAMPLHQKNIEIAGNFLMPWFVRADTIAVKSQKIYERIGFLVYVLSPIAVALVAMGILVQYLSRLSFSLEFLILLFAYGAITIADKAKVHKKWIECRYLAEHIRCAIYFAACGFKPEVIKNTLQSYHRHQTGNWAAKMFNQIVQDMPALHHRQQTDIPADLEFIKMCWIEDQMTFHAKKAVRTGKKGRRIERAGKIVFFAALFAALTHIVLAYYHFEKETPLVETIATFIAISFPALGASLGAIRIHREYSRLEHQSADMVKQLEWLKREYDEISTQHEFSAFLVKTQEKMLRDVQGWLTLMELIILESV
jgi:hypothetical protein